jgi:hypothetical protein
VLFTLVQTGFKRLVLFNVNLQLHETMALISNITQNRWPGSSVGLATGYGLDGKGIESRWGRDLPHLSRPTLGPTQPHVVSFVPHEMCVQALNLWRRSFFNFSTPCI